MASRPKMNWIGQTISDRYKLEAILGQGGMSTVYKANDPNLQRSVAIKLIHPHLSSDPEFVRRFEQEAAAVAQLRHPNIIQVYDFNHDGDIYYMVLEHVPGQTLRDRLKAFNDVNQRFPLADTIRIMAITSEAVAYAHERGMIHRDLKPPNIMLTPKGEPILMDFGVAKMLSGTQHTATGAIVGTARYMSPEQARGERPDERSDIYALGVILYEMLAGQPPFDADTTVAVLMKHVNEPVPDLRQIKSDIPNDLVAVVGKALAKDRSERFQAANHLAIALKSINLQAGEMDAADTIPTPFKKKQETDPSLKTVAASSLSVGVPAAQPAEQPSSGGSKLWLIGAAAIVLLLIIAFGTFVLISQLTGSSDEGEAQAGTLIEDPNLPSSEGMARIDAGTYTVGLDPSDRDHAATQQVELAEFWIDMREVTNAQYAEFVAATNGEPPAEWPNGHVPADEENHPVKGVTWDMATAYCDWANKRLPSEAEWEIAARGPERRLYPWGDNQRAVELPRSGTYAVGSKATNQSSFGVFDMAGNVWEWVGDPYAPVDEEGHRVLHGGANGFLKDMAYRLQGDPTVPTMIASAGIRCAADQVHIVEADEVLAEGILYEDTFDDPNSGWPILAEGTFLFGYHPPDFYHVEISTPNDHTAISRPPDFEDVTVEAEVQVDHTDTENGDFRYGLALRRSAADQYYAFTVSNRSSTWQVLKRSSSSLEVLAEGSVDTLRGFAPQGFTPDTPDLLRVDAQGSDLVFYINGEPVTQISDTDYASGEVGFYVETFDETLAHVHYDRLTVRELGTDQVGQAEPTQSVQAEGVLLEDSFDNPESGWPVMTEDTRVFGYHPPDFYHVEASTSDNVAVISRQPDFGDVTAEAEVQVDHTDTENGDFRYGLVLRRSAEDQYYAFVVSSRSANWQVLKSSSSGLEVMAEGSVNTLRGFAPQGFTPETSDMLRVDANGSDFVFHINGEPVVQFSDSDYVSGEVGFYVETFDETLAHVHYDKLTIKDVETEAFGSAPAAVAVSEVEGPLPTSTSVSDTLPTAATEAEAPAETPSPIAEEAPAPEATATSATSTSDGAPDEMVLIPSGSFLMGSAAGEPNETPEHQVSLDAFYIDQFEVSNAKYGQCVNDGGCTQTSTPDSFTRQGYRDDPTYSNYPVIGVNWDQAVAYCQWAGKRLPTEAEWEYAARGPENLTWPWGNSFDPELSAASAPDTQPVDSYPEGVSPFGVYNMAGNVAEWVQDVFDESFYANSPARNPVSSGGSAGRIYRGGSFANPDGAYYTTSRRYGNVRSFSEVDVGIRCAMDAS